MSRDTENNRVQVLKEDIVIKVFSQVEGLPNGISSPSGVEVLGEKVYVADSGHHRIVVLDKSTGKLLGYFEKGRDDREYISEPRGFALLPGPMVLLADRYNHRVHILGEASETEN